MLRRLQADGIDRQDQYKIEFAQEDRLLTKMAPTNDVNEADQGFCIRIARTEEQLRQVARLRFQSYARILPTLKTTVIKPDDSDYSARAVVLLAEDRATGTPLATVRIETADESYYVPRDLLGMPEGLAPESTTYYSRLAACNGRRGHAAKLSVMKAAVRYSLAVGKPWVLAAAPPGRTRNYRMLGLSALTDQPPVTMPDHPEIQLILLGVNLFDLERESRDRDDGFLRFLFAPDAPEIEVFNSVRGSWVLPRADSVPTDALPDFDHEFGVVVV